MESFLGQLGVSATTTAAPDRALRMEILRGLEETWQGAENGLSVVSLAEGECT